MKRIIIVIVILFCTASVQASTTSQNNKIETLKKSFLNKNWKRFANNFPKTFDAFLEVYGYDDEGPMPLYCEGYEHIQFLFSDDRILKDFYLQKLLNLTKGYMWNADGPAILGNHVWNLINNNPYIISKFLEKQPDEFVKDFLKCAIATPHPEPDNRSYYDELLKTIELYENYSDKIVRLFKDAHQELMEEWPPLH